MSQCSREPTLRVSGGTKVGQLLHSKAGATPAECGIPERKRQKQLAHSPESFTTLEGIKGLGGRNAEKIP